MDKGPKIALILIGSAAAASGGYWYYTTHNNSFVLPKGGTAKGSGSGHSLGGARNNAKGESVSLSAPSNVSSGSAVKLTASGHGFSNPVYQFWWSDGKGWHQSGAYSSSNVAQFTPSAGTYKVIVYARESSAPSNETSSQQKQYEANSAVYQVTVA